MDQQHHPWNCCPLSPHALMCEHAPRRPSWRAPSLSSNTGSSLLPPRTGPSRSSSAVSRRNKHENPSALDCVAVVSSSACATSPENADAAGSGSRFLIPDLLSTAPTPRLPCRMPP